MWLMMQQEKPDDYVIATGETHSVKEFVEKAFAVVNIKVRWEGEGVNEVGINVDTNDVIVRVDPRYFRPTEVDFLLGDPSKAKKQLGWVLETSFDVRGLCVTLRTDTNSATRERDGGKRH